MFNGVSSRWCCWFSVVLAVCLFGCGPEYPDTYKVSGKVTVGGQPASNVYVVFIPEEGRMGTGKTDENGDYKLTTFNKGDGAVPGEHTVTISNPDISEGTGNAGSAPIPPEYATRQTSTIKKTVENSSNTINIEL